MEPKTPRRACQGGRQTAPVPENGGRNPADTPPLLSFIEKRFWLVQAEIAGVGGVGGMEEWGLLEAGRRRFCVSFCPERSVIFLLSFACFSKGNGGIEIVISIPPLIRRRMRNTRTATIFLLLRRVFC